MSDLIPRPILNTFNEKGYLLCKRRESVLIDLLDGICSDLMVLVKDSTLIGKEKYKKSLIIEKYLRGQLIKNTKKTFYYLENNNQ